MRSRSPVRAVVAASLAFALVSAAAAGTAFSVNSVQGFAVASAAVGSFDVSPCTGSFDITWSVSGGEIVGVKATRVPPSTVSDPGLMFCADMPYAVLIGDEAAVRDGPRFNFSAPGWKVEWQGTTDAAGSIDASSTAPESGSLSLAVGTAVQLAIGPDPLGVMGPTAVCAPLATGGRVDLITVGDDRYCVHTYDTVGTDTFTVVADTLDVEYLVVGGGGGGGATLGGGGGAGGLATNVGAAPETLEAGDWGVGVGAGGQGATALATPGENGSPSFLFVSSLGSFTGSGGTGGASGATSAGGQGGSTFGPRPIPFFPPPILAVGNEGGAGSDRAGGGGGGRAAVGSAGIDGPPVAGGAGGDGVSSAIGGIELLFAGGGGGGSEGGTAGAGGGGGPRGGGPGSSSCDAPGTSAAPRTGSGGGGGGFDVGADPAVSACPGGAGGSGVVIVRYRAP